MNRDAILDVKRFRYVWRQLARNGTCDTIDGAEYHRVWHEWAEADFPEGIAAFIAARANIDADGKPGNHHRGS